MTDILDFGSIDEHADMINTFHSQYGDIAWLLIYQADVRFRQEHLEQIGFEIDIENQTADPQVT